MPIKDPQKRKEYYRAYGLRNKQMFRDANRRSRYGVAPPEPSRCEACGTHKSKLKRGLALDHDHKTGAFRGFLCSPCNLALGHVGDSKDRLQLLIHYLENVEILK
jgi:hypothetical protein